MASQTVDITTQVSDSALSGTELREWMAPTAEALRALACAVEETGPRHGAMPSADSVAMGELADQDSYGARSGWEQPVADTHEFGSMTLLASLDYVRSFANLFATDRAPVYGQFVLARAALESSVVAWWLSERDIANEERLKRGLCELIYSAQEEKRLGLSPTAAETLAEREGFADQLGWRLGRDRRGRPVVGDARRPAPGAGITRLVVADPGAPLGKVLWSRLSAVNHVARCGLAWALEPPEEPGGAVGGSTVPIQTDSRTVAVLAFCILRALRVSASERFKIMGWVDEPWTDAAIASKKHELTLIRSAAGASS